MGRILLACLLLAGCASGSIPSGVIDPFAPVTPPSACGDLDAYAVKWQALLGMRDWRIQLTCAAISEKEMAVGISWPNPYERLLPIVIDPEVADHELIVLHEMAHALFDLNCLAKSELVEEQLVVTLSELLRGLEKGTP